MFFRSHLKKMCQKLNQPIWLFTNVFGKRTQKRFKIEKFAIKVHLKNKLRSGESDGK